MRRASRYRLYPDQTQERQFAQLCGAGRFVCNEGLREGVVRGTDGFFMGCPMDTAGDSSTMWRDDRDPPSRPHGIAKRLPYDIRRLGGRRMQQESGPASPKIRRFLISSEANPTG